MIKPATQLDIPNKSNTEMHEKCPDDYEVEEITAYSVACTQLWVHKSRTPSENTNKSPKRRHKYEVKRLKKRKH